MSRRKLPQIYTTNNLCKKEIVTRIILIFSGFLFVFGNYLEQLDFGH